MTGSVESVLDCRGNKTEFEDYSKWFTNEEEIPAAAVEEKVVDGFSVVDRVAKARVPRGMSSRPR